MNGHEMSGTEALEFLLHAPMGTEVPPYTSAAWVTVLAVRELAWRHDRLCEAVLGVLTDDGTLAPEGMTQLEYRAYLREHVEMALNGVPR